MSTSPSSRTAGTATPAACIAVGKIAPAAQRLIDITHEAMWIGIRQVRPGARLGDLGAAIQSFVEAAAPVHGARILRPRHRPDLS